MAGLGSLREPKLCFSGEPRPVVTFQWFSSVYALIGFTLSGSVDAGQWDANPRPPSGADWTGISAESQLCYLALCLPLLSISVQKYNVREKITDFFQRGLAWLGLALFFLHFFYTFTLLSSSCLVDPSCDLHLACSLPLNCTVAYPSVCVTSSWKTRSNPSGV